MSHTVPATDNEFFSLLQIPLAAGQVPVTALVSKKQRAPEDAAGFILTQKC